MTPGFTLLMFFGALVSVVGCAMFAVSGFRPRGTRNTFGMGAGAFFAVLGVAIAMLSVAASA